MRHHIRDRRGGKRSRERRADGEEEGRTVAGEAEAGDAQPGEAEEDEDVVEADYEIVDEEK